MNIKPCPTPWCRRRDKPETYQGPTDQWQVYCPDCCVEGPDGDTEEDAIDAWNAREQVTS